MAATTRAEQFLVRVGARADKPGNWWAIILPVIMDLINALLEGCQTEQVLADCENVSRLNRRRLRRGCMAGAIESRRVNGWGLFEAARIGRDAAEAVANEAEATVNGDKPMATDIVEEFRAL